MRDLFGEHYNIKTLVDDARRDTIKELPFDPKIETKEEYMQTIIKLTNEEVARRREVMGCKNPDYKPQNLILRKKI